ncbi:hypothetical protein PFICI_13957 [Pestalotiopsis fici W106-1]|uniref:Enoyl reductase (ER) domain-containing protein n=1 Tax=Pestalotiopsis fici (strain W106-1 / CGMCC3.15140) TaxID=1229662 RepID=W3WMP6_PESFW|nr:uncharacterized protein PFICI_13957 [Pestalotiopsis fici W106-1]ETS74091.1 hypothetical protein PFICI_13957 [Pestalotiopsis fici W106-1]
MSSLAQNRAAWIDAPGKAIRVGAHDLRKLRPGEILVRNRAVAVNPFDCLQQSTGEFVEQWPCILGHDLAGDVVSVGEGVVAFAPGQRVLAQALQQGPENTAFQEHSIIGEDVTCPIPDTLTYESASVVPLALSTAAAGLYQKGYLELPLPSASPLPGSGEKKTLLVWGGSSSVGTAAIQLAVASGLEVVTTASPKNFALCRRLGAKEVFDYHSPTVIEDLVAAVKRNGQVAGAFTAVSQPSEVIMTVARVLEKLGGGFIATSKPPPEKLPAGVAAKMVFATDYAIVEGKKFFRDFLPSALANGSYVAAPEPHVVGHGLEHIQTGLEVLSKGVSAQKIVVTL